MSTGPPSRSSSRRERTELVLSCADPALISLCSCYAMLRTDLVHGAASSATPILVDFFFVLHLEYT
eukprot:478866-Rhodomonas_salina.1